jgi:hypothetical protein
VPRDRNSRSDRHVRPRGATAGPVEWAVERQGTGDGATTVETVAFDVPTGVLRVVDHRVPDPGEEGVEAATVRLPLREGVAAQFAETVDRHDRGPEAHLRDLVTEAASVHAVPHLSSVDPERLSEEQREQAGAVREAGRAEWIGRVARGEDVREVSRDVPRHTATAIERVTGETREDGESDGRTR